MSSNDCAVKDYTVVAAMMMATVTMVVLAVATYMFIMNMMRQLQGRGEERGE